jgi:hypothetical protein
MPGLGYAGRWIGTDAVPLIFHIFFGPGRRRISHY